MTSIVGVKTPSGIVIAGDSNLQYFDNKGRETYSRNQPKIHTGKYHAMASFGWHDKYFDAFEDYVAGDIGLGKYLAMISENCHNRTLDGLVGDVRPKLAERVEAILAEHPQVNKSSIMAALRENGGRQSRAAQSLAIELYNFLTEHYTHPFDYALKDGKFRELALLNELRKQRHRRFVDVKPDDSELLIAINDPVLELYSVDGQGVMKTAGPMEDIEYLARGSGQEDMERYIDTELWHEDSPDIKKGIGKMRALKIRLNQAIWLAVGAVIYACRRDTYSSEPIHIAVVKEGSVRNHVVQIDESYSNWRRSAYGKVAREHTQRRKR